MPSILCTHHRGRARARLLILGALAWAVVIGGDSATGQNLLRNPGFEADERHWATHGQWWYESPKGSGLSAWNVDRTVAHSGSRSLRLTGTGNRGVASQEVPAVPGADYRASGWVRTARLGNAQADFDIGFIGEGGKWLGGQSPPSINGDNDWTYLACAFTAPPGARGLRMHLFTRSANRGVVWFDDLNIERVLPPAPVGNLKVRSSGRTDVLLDWSGYQPRDPVQAFRVYQSEQPFDDTSAAKRVAEVKAPVHSHIVSGSPRAYFAVTAVDGEGRESPKVSSASVFSERLPDLVAPDCLWADTFASAKGIFATDKAEVADGSVRLSRERDREWFRSTDQSRCKREGGWPEGPRCSVPGGALAVRFSGHKLLAYGAGAQDLGIVEVSVDGGKTTELDLYSDWTPTRQIVLAADLPDAPHTATLRLTGRKNDRSAGLAAQFDLFEVFSKSYAREGFALSEPILCSPDSSFRWLSLRYGAATPDGTTVSVDVLNAAGEVLLANAPDEADLSALRSPIVQLRATLRTSDGRASPLLAFWQVEYRSKPQPRSKLGLVLNAVTAKPIARARVAVRSATGVRTRTAAFTTDPSGHFATGNLAPGHYQIIAGAKGFLQSAPRTVALMPAAPLSIALFPSDYLLGKRLQWWPVSTMDSIFQDAVPPLPPPSQSAIGNQQLAIRLEAAANEHEPAQLALRPLSPVGRVRLSVTPLRHAGLPYSIGPSQVRTYFVGYVPVVANSPSVPEGELARQAPAYFPDPLLTDQARELMPGQTQPVWITVRAPRDAPPGQYRGALRIQTAYGAVLAPIELRVWPFALTEESHVWFGHGGSGWGPVISHYAQTGTDEENWRVIRRALKDRAAHRENVIYLDGSVFGLCHITVTDRGGWKYDFTELDRWIKTIQETYPHGRFLIEGGCFASRDGWTASEIFFNGCAVYNAKGEQDPDRSLKRTSTDSEEFRRFARPFFAALQKHLAQKGMLGKFYTRLQDEPLESCRPAYQRLASLVHESAPRLRRFESIQTTGLADCLEIQNPQLDWFDRERDYFLKTRRPGCQIWFYTCWMPRGRYPCRLIDYPLLKHRIIHWMLRRFGVDGYDRWGWACWPGDAMGAYDFASPLAPGDNFVVYPDPRRKEIIGSLRWEMMREGAEDYEYLWTLGERLRKVARWLGAREREFDTNQRALELCAKAVTTCTDYQRDPTRLLALRQEVAREITAAQARPFVVFETDPPCVGVTASRSVKVRGITEKGATVTVNDQPVKVRQDGRFAATAVLSPSQTRLILCVSRGKVKRVVLREFNVADQAESDMLKVLERAEKIGLSTAAARASLDHYRQTLGDTSAPPATLEAARQATVKATADLSCAEVGHLAASLLSVKECPGPTYQALKVSLQKLMADGQFDVGRVLAARVGKLDARRFDAPEHGAVVVPTVFAGRTGFLLKNSRVEAVIWDQGGRIIDFRIDGVPLLNQLGVGKAVSPEAWTDIGGYEDAGQGLLVDNMGDWQVELRQDSEAKVQLACAKSLAGGLRIERLVSLQEHEIRLRLDYTIANTGSTRLDADWRAHTEFAIGTKQGNLGGDPAGDEFIVPTVNTLRASSFDLLRFPDSSGETRVTLTGNYAGALDAQAKAAVLHLLCPEASTLTIWIDRDLYTMEPWIHRSLAPGEAFTFTNYLVAVAPVASAQEAVQAIGEERLPK